jgi:membrane-bound lytic murein transglycosylase A
MKHLPPAIAFAPATALAVALLAGCNTAPDNAKGATDPPPATNVAASAPSPDTNVAGQAHSFSTGIATYTAVGFESLPGWYHDSFAQSWPVFLNSCRVLSRRGAPWRPICERARQVDGKNNAAIRNFFESEFAAYQIRGDDRRPYGVVTGYFEPEIEGSRNYAPPYVYPVYGQPEDMFYLDARKLPASGVAAARVEGQQVILQPGLSTRDLGGVGLYMIDFSQLKRDSLDRKVRLRIEGRYLLPYYTRQEIEARGAPNARVLAFVSKLNALYEMQVQGSGRIRLPDGSIIRLTYAEQNGQPFRPMLAANTAKQVRTRGNTIELDPGDDEDDDDSGTDTDAVRVRGFKLALPARTGAVAVPGKRVASTVAGSGNSDPSYVFFKETTDSTDNPPGALGVPLSPERSIAVDPRSMPLGYPVYLSTRLPGGSAPVERLTIAQDTGGAIRGAVRADYFLGKGQRAATLARRMKERGQLWVLLPRGQQVAAATTAASGPGAIRTRGGTDVENRAQCLIPQEDVCVNDDD